MKHLKHNLLPLITLAGALLMAQSKGVEPTDWEGRAGINVRGRPPLFLNYAPYPAWVGVHYPHCKDDHTVIAPGDMVIVEAGSCTASHIEGVLAPVEGNPSKNITIKTLNNPNLVFGAIIIRPTLGGSGYEFYNTNQNSIPHKSTIQKGSP